MTWRNPTLKGVTKRAGAASCRVSASWAVGDGSGHTSPSHVRGQLCGRDDGGHRRFPPGKPAPEACPSEIEEKAAYSFATCNWGNTNLSRAYKSAFSELATTQAQGNAMIPLPAPVGAKRLREAALGWWLLQLALCPWEMLWLILQEVLTQGFPQGSLQLHKAAGGLPWSPAPLHHSDHGAALVPSSEGQGREVPELSRLPEREML